MSNAEAHTPLLLPLGRFLRFPAMDIKMDNTTADCETPSPIGATGFLWTERSARDPLKCNTVARQNLSYS